ncbi:hypothetical protein BCL32_1778 [Rhizobium mongolense USDA 1844]|uniref:Uncharacterized protein n=1 Tax=Rhizobium mongolense USDA 1844 TaxID=1079460 RepID=A0A559TG07_9HYPH|nr:hypothetical protein [Rhizobium mongolense]TVZ73544.1 hypothetical protein BCL32_1778 [Rhizobium mongolense USDA 1844]
MRVLPAIALTCAICLTSNASASEENFLKSIEGQWTGGGAVLTKLGGSTVDVSCKMQSDAQSSSFSMNGSCRAFAVVTRSFTANVKASGEAYSGIYVGISGKPSKLVGSRDGNMIKLDVTWANTIYGDRQAKMTIEKVGEDGLRIRTIDQDPASGKSIVTTQLDLRRR